MLSRRDFLSSMIQALSSTFTSLGKLSSMMGGWPRMLLLDVHQNLLPLYTAREVTTTA
jgi:hypothetical protein